MSGLEVAGIVLGAFPLLLAAIEHWHDIANIYELYRRTRRRYKECQHDIEYEKIICRRNLEALLTPILLDADEVDRLVADPGGQGWSDPALQERLEERLHGSYHVYREIITKMEDIVHKLKKELSIDEGSTPSKLSTPEHQGDTQDGTSSPQKSTKPSIISGAMEYGKYKKFQIKFSLRERVRNDLLDELNKCNKRLKNLLSSSDRVSSSQNVASGHGKEVSKIDKTFAKIARRSDQLFKALNNAWQCSCQAHHSASLLLEHRTLAEVCFEIVLMSIAPTECVSPSWRWKQLSCGHKPSCSVVWRKSDATPSTPLPCRLNSSTLQIPRTSIVSSASRSKRGDSLLDPPKIVIDSETKEKIQLCQRLSDRLYGECLAVIGHDKEIFHLHPTTRDGQVVGDPPTTLDQILSHDSEHNISRVQRYTIALLIASSVGQLRSTPWMRNGLCKENIIFYPREDDNQVLVYNEPYIRRNFSHAEFQSSPDVLTNDCNFYPLGILLLELCFGHRLEDDPLRQRKPTTNDIETRHALDLVAAMEWKESVGGESGGHYAAAVNWCFSSVQDRAKGWRGDFIRNVIWPLDICIKHLKTPISV
ncbi:unnamed protein product [Alternaria alternata]